MIARCLEDSWRETLDAVAQRRGWPTTNDPARLGAKVSLLSATYNDRAPANVHASSSDALAARLLFSFPRDVPKGAAAVRELVASGALTLPEDRPLRVLDYGAGLGAMSWGVARALSAAGKKGRISVVLYDTDEDALLLAKEILSRRTQVDGVTLEGSTARASFGGSIPKGPFDLILLGHVLSELDRTVRDEERLSRHVELVTTLLTRSLDPEGSLVIVEPALRDRTRHLHEVRDALLSADPVRATVFAPCLHSASCPALVNPTDWCHEDLPIDLPPWLVPTARAAGLRWEGLTFSYLVLRRDGRTFKASLPEALTRLRVVSGRVVTKGKIEIFLCGELQDAEVGRVRARRLDRERTESNAAWDELLRGEVISIEPPFPTDVPRLTKESRVVVLSQE